MKEEEDAASYFLRVDEIVNYITWLGDAVKEKGYCAENHENSSHMLSIQRCHFLNIEVIWTI